MPDSPESMHPRCSEPFLIGCGVASDAAPSPASLGFKAYNLWRMDRVGLPVPPAFVLGTDHCRQFLSHGGPPAARMRDLLSAQIRELERSTGLGFGSMRRPLCVSVRSGAAISMPGMMDTILNVGLNGATVRGLLRLTGNPRLAWDSYRRLVQSFAEVVHHFPAERFAQAQATRLRESRVESVRELDFQALKGLAEDYLELYEDHAGTPFPQNPFDQLEAAVASIWKSWSGDKAAAYRKLSGLPDDLGTAVTVQRMVYGNAGGTSGAGVAFTRDPASGEPQLYLDFLFNAQGEDVVSGRHGAPDGVRMAQILPALKEDLARVAFQLEREFGDMQEFEFTVQDGRLFILQTRTSKRSPWAELKIAVDQVEEGLIDAPAAVSRLAHLDAHWLGRARVVPAGGARVLCRAVVANIGVAVGQIMFDPAKAAMAASSGRAVILVRGTAATEDITGIAAAAGILTATGGRTSHAAVVARQLDKVCLVGCESLAVDADGGHCTIAGETFREGDVLSLDGHSGDVIAGEVQVEFERPVAELAKLAEWRRQLSG
ncbi:MAG: PEP/pyruvate-binding domain-containing protein [Usitatibacter sp.]